MPVCLPALHFAEVERHGPVGDGLHAEVLGIAADERGHVVAWNREEELGGERVYYKNTRERKTK